MTSTVEIIALTAITHSRQRYDVGDVIHVSAHEAERLCNMKPPAAKYPRQASTSVSGDGDKKSSRQKSRPSTKGTGGGTGGDEPAIDRVNINTATQDELEALNGVGPKPAQAIIDGREWGTVDQLASIDGIGADTLSSLKAHLTV